MHGCVCINTITKDHPICVWRWLEVMTNVKRAAHGVQPQSFPIPFHFNFTLVT